MSELVIRAHDVHVSYGDTIALAGADLELRAGAVHGLIGTNGSGKSTLFKSLMGLVRVDRGSVELFGDAPVRARRSSRVAYAPQSEDVDWAFPITVRDVVAMGRYGRLGWRRAARQADRDAVDDALARVELTDLAHRQIGALSGGQRKRAFVARGLAQGAELVFLDEPFAGVDKRSEAMIASLLREHADAGGTIVVSTHDLVGAPSLCDTVTLISRRVIAHGPTADVLVPDLVAEAFGGFVPHDMLASHAEAPTAPAGSGIEVSS